MMQIANFDKRLTEYEYRKDTLWKDNKIANIKWTRVDSSNLQITKISMLEIQSIVEIKKGKSTKITPYKISLVLPKGSNRETELGHLKLASFKYEEMGKYLKKLAQKSDKYTFTTKSQEKITFAQALEQRLFTSNIMKRYETIFDQYLISILYHKYEGSIDNSQQKMQEEGKAILDYMQYLGQKSKQK